MTLLHLQISPSAGTPIYRQLMDQITRLVASRSLKAGEELPSVRSLAEQLEVNPMTVSKAYSALEMHGVLVRRRGLGMVVADSKELQLALGDRLEQLAACMERLRLEAQQLNVSDEQLMSALKKHLRNAGDK
ncbi:MAG: GntR family transcriptional regulator [Pseudohongiellaceae bacterium]